MMAPHMAPLIGVAVAWLSAARSEEPGSAFKPPVMTVIPSRNRPYRGCCRHACAFSVCPDNQAKALSTGHTIFVHYSGYSICLPTGLLYAL
jgi:hypothetical protein